MPTQFQFPHPTYSQTVLQPAYQSAQRYLFPHMLAAHEAHTIMLAECDIITRENAQAILRAVADIRADGVDALAYQPGVEDLFFRIESQIIEQIGPDYGGNLQLARSRNDLGHALDRMSLRDYIRHLADELLTLRATILDLARRHTATIMPGYTHTQPAQPVTFAHYLAGVLSFLQNDFVRLATAYGLANASPLGAAAFTGTGFPIDRQRVAALLGYDSVIASTQHSIGAGDHLTDTAFAIQSLAIGLGRITKDLLFHATNEANALHIDDSFIQISSIMPQKRNPVVLEHLRARLSRAFGYAQTVVVQCHSIPYGDTQDIEDEIKPPLMHAVETMQECLRLYTAFFETLTLNEAHLRERARAGFTTATELADALVRNANLPFRTAHKIVATLVKMAVAQDKSANQLTIDMLQAAAQQVLERNIDFTAAQMVQALDPVHFVNVRAGFGGVAPTATAALLDELDVASQRDAEWLQAAQGRLNDADNARATAVHTLLGT